MTRIHPKFIPPAQILDGKEEGNIATLYKKTETIKVNTKRIISRSINDIFGSASASRGVYAAQHQSPTGQLRVTLKVKWYVKCCTARRKGFIRAHGGIPTPILQRTLASMTSRKYTHARTGFDLHVVKRCPWSVLVCDLGDGGIEER